MRYNEPKVLSSVEDYLKQLKRKRRIKNGLFISFLFIILILLFLLYSPFFNIKYLEVYGTYKYDQQYILDVCEISLGQNIFKINERRALDNLKQQSYIKGIEIVRKFPNRVNIIITERKPLATTFFDGQYLIIDKEGRVLENVGRVIEGYPEIKGININSLMNFNELNNTIIEDESLNIALQILNVAEKVNFYQDGKEQKHIQKINYIDVSNLYDVKLLIEDRFNVNFGESNKLKDETIIYRFQLLEALYNEKSLKNKTANVNMTEPLVSERKTYIVSEVEDVKN